MKSVRAMHKLLRQIKAILRHPATPPLLIIVIAAHALWVGYATNHIKHNSVLGELVRNRTGWFGNERQWRLDQPWWYAYVVRDPTGDTRLIPGESRGESGIPKDLQVAFLMYGSSEWSESVYMPLRTRRDAFLRIDSDLPSTHPDLAPRLDEFVDLIIASPNHYRCLLEPPRAAAGLKDPKNAGFFPKRDIRLVEHRVILWSGYLHNTFAATALIALLISTPWSLCTIPGRIRRWRWKRAGSRCLGCGYDINGLEKTTVCPECGRAIVPS